MLSVAIPIYNYDCTSLVKTLVELIERSGIDGEVICVDDCSADEFHEKNRSLESLRLVKYSRLEQNIGRSAIRNKIVQFSNYEYLLFLDCDSKVVRPDFIENYLPFLDSGEIVSGGRVYAVEKPSPEYLLHWTYGIERESRQLSERTKFPVRYFHSNNFLAPKKVLLDHPFDEAVAGYGYEDLMLAKRLVENEETIRHIDNPIRHIGLDTNERFLEKTRNAVHNLLNFSADGITLNTRLEKSARRIKSLGLSLFVCRMILNKEQKYIDQLCSSEPSMRKMDLLKLAWYLQEKIA